jgi:hypothetical protein
MIEAIDVRWHDSGREPSQPANPKFPCGMDIDFTAGATRTCLVQLPYPARRCGFYSVKCRTCSYSIAIATAGRLDDPRSVKLACQ